MHALPKPKARGFLKRIKEEIDRLLSGLGPLSGVKIAIVCSHGTVFPSIRLELSPSMEYNSRDLSISPMLKLLYLTSFFEVFTVYSSLFSLEIQITECFNNVIKILE